MNAETILAALPIWQETPELTPVEEGRTNRNFIIRDGDARYFGRVGIDLPHHGISRANERLCAELAAQAGTAPEVCHASDGVLVTRLIEGETLRPSTIHDREVLRETAALLRRLHAWPVHASMLTRRCGVAMALAYVDGLPDGALPVPRPSIIERLGAPMLDGECLVHCDIIPENLIRGASGLMLIDWEYGGVGIPEIDLASVIVNADLDRTEADHFIAVYGPCDAGRVERQRVALVIREALWCLTQMHHAGAAGDLVSYTRLCIDRMSKEFP
jgi:thiamine kinase-like enzyme